MFLSKTSYRKIPHIHFSVIFQVDKYCHQLDVFVSLQDWHEVVNKSSKQIVQSVVSVKVTSDVSAFCNASNGIGAEVRAFSIKASKSNFHCMSGS